MTNTGTCPGCFRQREIDNSGKIAVHSWVIPDERHAYLRCHGSGYNPVVQNGLPTGTDLDESLINRGTGHPGLLEWLWDHEHIYTKTQLKSFWRQPDRPRWTARFKEVVDRDLGEYL